MAARLVPTIVPAGTNTHTPMRSKIECSELVGLLYKQRFCQLIEGRGRNTHEKAWKHLSVNNRSCGLHIEQSTGRRLAAIPTRKRWKP